MISSLWHRLTKGKEPKLLDSADIAKCFNCSDVEIDHVLEEYRYQEDIGGYWGTDGTNSRYFPGYVPTKHRGSQHCASLKITGYSPNPNEQNKVSYTPLWYDTILEVLKAYI